MLPDSLQQRLVADVAYNKPLLSQDLRKFTEPYRTVIRCLQATHPADRLDVLFDLGNWHDDIKAVVQAVQGLNFEKDLASYDEDWIDAQLAEPQLEWLWDDWLPRRHVSLLVSYGGVGKSFIVLDWLSRWLMQREAPDGQCFHRQGDTAVFCDGEDFFQAYAQRTRDWQAANLWPQNKKTGIFLHRRLHKSKEYRLTKEITKWQLIDFANQQEQDRLVNLVYRRRPEILVIDSISSTFADSTFDKEVREPLGFITALTDEYNLVTILVHHYNKNQSIETRPDVNNIKGAGAFVNFSRAIFTLHYEKVFNPYEVDRKKDPRVLTPLKNNFSMPDTLGVWFRPLEPHGVFIEYTPVEEIYAMAAEIREQEAEQQETVVDDCAGWLVQYLRDNGPASRRDLVKAGKRKNYTAFVIDKARQSLGDTVADTLGKRSRGNKWRLAAAEDNENETE